MPLVNISPNMLLPVPVPTQDPGPDWANQIYACLYSQIDAHDHSNGKGVQVTPAGLNINVDLSFQTHSATHLLTSSYTSQPAALSGATYPAAAYVAGGELWYNDLVGNQVQLTSGGMVNATSSGISSGTATASFVSSVLVVNAAANTPANIQGGSIFLGNNVANSKYLELSPPSAMAANYSLVLPALPGSTSFVTLDTSGNLSGGIPVLGSLTTSNLSASAGILGTQIASTTIAKTNLQALGQQTSGLITFTINGSTADVTNSTLTIVTTGRPVTLFLSPSSGTIGYIQQYDQAGGNQSPIGTIALYRSDNGGSTFNFIGGVQLQASTIASFLPVSIGPSNATFFDQSAGAGSHIYKLEANTPGIAQFLSIVSCNLVAYEN